MTIVNAAQPAEINRDRWGRPLVVPKGGGKRIPYTRATTYIDVLEDKYNLQKWMQRMVALGLAARPDLQLAVAAHPDDKRELDRICDAAREAATASAAATTGTALHALTELVDRGQKLPVLPDTAKADLDAYTTATADLKAVLIEQFCVQDALQVGGTPDRIVEVGGTRFIADIKTGSIEWGALKIAMQLALYARSHTYDIATAERGIHDADLTRGIVIHLPAGEASCQLHWIDLEAGWAAVQVAKDVRSQRALKFKDLTEPFTPTVPDLSMRRARETEQRAATDTQRRHERLLAQIAACPTADDVRDVWARNEDIWTDALTEAAKARITELPTAS